MLRLSAALLVFFDLVALQWKAARTNPLPLHRICTLARKQNATYVLIESAFAKQDLREDIDDLDAQLGGGGAAEAVAISFFASDAPPSDISAVEEKSFLGQVLLINYRSPGSAAFTNSFIYEAVLAPPLLRIPGGEPRRLLNNFIASDGEFRCSVKDREFTLRGIYYCQQNGVTHVCAHACLRMALNSIGGYNPPLTSRAINQTLVISPPLSGLSLGQIAQVIDAAAGVEAAVVDCSNLPAPRYLSIMASILDSGCVALLVFTTGTSNLEHVVTVFGYTRNADEWHPQAIPQYAGPQSARYYPSSSWVDHLLVHDDNFGPYLALSGRALEVNQSVKAHWLVGIYPQTPRSRPDFAEALAPILLTNLLPSLAPLHTTLATLHHVRWFEYITRTQWDYVLRPILISKDRYIEHLRTSTAHDGSTMSDQDLQLFDPLPGLLWMVEFSLPSLFTGNRSKLGEVILDAETVPTTAQPFDIFRALRVPGLVVFADAARQLTYHPAGLTAHSPLHNDDSQVFEW